MQDKALEAQVRERLAHTLQDRGDWPAALKQFQSAVRLLEPARQSVYPRLASAILEWDLGRAQESSRHLTEIERSLAFTPNPDTLFDLRMFEAKVYYASGSLDRARSAARTAATQSGGADISEARSALLQALADIRASGGRQGFDPAAVALKRFEQARLIGDAAAARLSIAEALAASGQRPAASQMAHEALAFSEPRRIWESVWRGRVIAAQAADTSAEAEAQLSSARSALAEMKNLWSADVVEAYMQRPDIRRLKTVVKI